METTFQPTGFLSRLRQWFRAFNIRRRQHRGWMSTELRRNRPPRPEALAVLGIMKNESHTIDEWVSHYLAMGVGKVFLIDNGSTDDTVAKARVWVDRGLVELVEYPEQHRQTAHYWAAFRHFRIADRFDWLAIADLDEFWFAKSGAPIPAVLAGYPEADVLICNWTQFGSSSHIAQPATLRSHFLMRDPEPGEYTKCIFRTHVPQEDGQIRVHDVRRVRPSRFIPANDVLQLNHYAIQSRDFWWKVKLKRGDVYYANPEMDVMERRFADIDARATLEDRLLADLVQGGCLTGPGDRPMPRTGT
jgi:hypothetical protein